MKAARGSAVQNGGFRAAWSQGGRRVHYDGKQTKQLVQLSPFRQFTGVPVEGHDAT